MAFKIVVILEYNNISERNVLSVKKILYNEIFFKFFFEEGTFMLFFLYIGGKYK